MKRAFIDFDKIHQGAFSFKGSSQVIKCLDFLNAGTFSTKYTLDETNERIFINSLFPSFPGESWNRFFQGVGRIAHGDRIPLWLDVVTTGECHCDCWHCFRSKYKEKSALPMSTIKTLMEDAYNLGTVMLGLTGGEPMLHTDLLEMINSTPAGMEILLYSTGHQINESFLSHVDDSRLTRCIISLDHYDPGIINNRRQYNGAFNDAVNALELLSQSNIFTSVALCMTEDLCSTESMYRYLELICALNVNELRIILPIPQGKLQGENHKRLYLDSRRLIKEIQNDTAWDESVPNIFLFADLESSRCLGCGAGFHYLCVNNDGQVCPCVSVPMTFGSIYDRSLQDIYMSMEKFFKSPGTTCFGRRMGRLFSREMNFPDIYPYSLESSHNLASRCIVDGDRPPFFKIFLLQ